MILRPGPGSGSTSGETAGIAWNVKVRAIFAYICAPLYQTRSCETLIFSEYPYTIRCCTACWRGGVSYGTSTAYGDMQYKVVQMKHSTAAIAICGILAALSSSAVLSGAVAPLAQDQKQEQKREQSSKQKAQAGTPLTGCVDEQQGHYVLVDESNLNLIADLVADGFPTEGFAKHVGHKVTVRGTSNSDGAHTVLKVRSIAMLSEICAPQGPQPEKKK